VIYVGVDVGKRSHEAAFLAEDGMPARPGLRFVSDRHGLGSLCRALECLEMPVQVALEASGHYWLTLYHGLRTAGYEVVTLNPLQTDAYRRAFIRKTKTDTRDAFLIADLLRIGRLRPGYVPDGWVLKLRELSRFRYGLADQVGDIKRRITALLDRVFPEYEGVFSDPFIKSSRELLATAATAEEFAALDPEELSKRLQLTSRGRFGAAKAQQIQQAAQESLGIPCLADAARVQLRCLLAQLELLQAQLRLVEHHLEDLLSQQEQFLTTIPGIGAVLAAALLGEIGDVSRFATFEKLSGYAGIDPSVFQTSEFTADSAHMSKRGSPYLRRALWQAAATARLFNPDLKAFFLRKREEGKPFGVAMGAVSNRLLARIYSVLKECRPYQLRLPNRLPTEAITT
jgi:transposase